MIDLRLRALGAVLALAMNVGCHVVEHGVARGISIEPPAVAPEGSTRLSVITFNMWHRDKPEHLALLAERLRRDLTHTPDFILCQEVLFSRPGWMGQHSTAAVLADELGYHCHGTQRTSDREGVAILSRHPFVYYAQRDLDARTSPFLLGFRRVSEIGEFLVPDVGRVRVVNTHLAYWPFEHEVRRRQLQETLDWVMERERQVPADVTIFGGDLNSEPGSSELSLITGTRPDAGLTFLDFNTRRPSLGSPGDPSSRVDYIFVAAPQRGIALLAERLLLRDGLRPPSGSRTIWVSDHLPVLHEYAVAARAEPGATDTLGQSSPRFSQIAARAPEPDPRSGDRQ